MIILVLNCGSSSLKYQVLDMKNESEYSLLAKGLVERIGLEMGEITHRVPEKDKFVIDKPIPCLKFSKLPKFSSIAFIRITGGIVSTSCVMQFQ